MSQNLVYSTRTWLTEPLAITDDTIYVGSVNTITNTIVQNVTAPVAVLGIMRIGLLADKNSTVSIEVYNNTTSALISSSNYKLVIENTAPILQITTGPWIATGNSLTITTLDGNIIYINGEQIKYSSANIVSNTLSGLSRGQNLTPVQYLISKYTEVWGLLPQNKMNDVGYVKTWNSYNYNSVIGDPLQISCTPEARFLTGNKCIKPFPIISPIPPSVIYSITVAPTSWNVTLLRPTTTTTTAAPTSTTTTTAAPTSTTTTTAAPGTTTTTTAAPTSTTTTTAAPGTTTTTTLAPGTTTTTTAAPTSTTTTTAAPGTTTTTTLAPGTTTTTTLAPGTTTTTTLAPTTTTTTTTLAPTTTTTTTTLAPTTTTTTTTLAPTTTTTTAAPTTTTTTASSGTLLVTNQSSSSGNPVGIDSCSSGAAINYYANGVLNLYSFTNSDSGGFNESNVYPTGQWLTSGDPSQYYMYVTEISGYGTYSGQTTGTWLQMNVDRGFGCSASAPSPSPNSASSGAVWTVAFRLGTGPTLATVTIDVSSDASTSGS